MFKEDYKKHYDNIHPSQELIETTKKRALEEYKKKLKSVKFEKEEKEEKEEEQKEEKYETECVDYGEEKVVFLGMKKRKILQIAGGLVASIALVAIGAVIGGSLRPQNSHVGSVVENTALPEKTEAGKEEQVIQKTENGKEKAKNGNREEKNNKKEEKNNKKKENGQSLTNLANMSNANGAILDYLSNNLVIFHGDFGIIGYNLSSRQVTIKIPASKLDKAETMLTQKIMVRTDGTIIAWQSMLASTLQIKLYDVKTGNYEEANWEEWKANNSIYSGVEGIAGTEADIYLAKASDSSVTLSDGRVCQLVYRAPDVKLQASLAIIILDLAGKREQIYDVFGEYGKQIVANQGGTYGGYYNEKGKLLFGENLEQTENPKETQTPEDESAVETEETVTPEETVEPVSDTPESVIETQKPVDPATEQEKTISESEETVQ